MKSARIILLPFFIFTNTCLSAQFSQSDIKIVVEGLSDEYTAKFKDTVNIRKFLNVLNEERLPQSIKPINILVKYKDGMGAVMVKVNYDHNDVYVDKNYMRYNSQWPMFGKGINVFFQDYLLRAVFSYTKSVGKKGWTEDNKIMALINSVALIKPNKNYAVFFSSNYADRRGFYHRQTLNNVELGYSGKKYNVQSTNEQTLNQNNFFFIGDLKGIDGKPTPYFYFCKFFEIDSE